jgi:hypothetical protein
MCKEAGCDVIFPHFPHKLTTQPKVKTLVAFDCDGLCEHSNCVKWSAHLHFHLLERKSRSGLRGVRDGAKEPLAVGGGLGGRGGGGSVGGLFLVCLSSEQGHRARTRIWLSKPCVATFGGLSQ